MALRLGIRDNPDSCLYTSGGGRGLFDCIVARDDYAAKYPLDQLYPLGPYNLAQPGRVGEQLIPDSTRNQIFYIQDFELQLIAGRYNAIGSKDGAGPDARFYLGGLQGSVGYTRNSKGEWFVAPDNGGIRKLVKGDPWQVSTFATSGGGPAITCDANDNIWVADFYGSRIIKFLADGSQQSFGTVSNLLQIWPVGNELIGMTRYNAWDIIVSFDMTTGVTTRIAGMLQEELPANPKVDGALLGEATFHSTGIVWVSSDGRKMLLIGGDECQFREVDRDTGRVHTLFVDGSWRETDLRIASPHPNTDPNLPFFSRQGGGRDLATGYPLYSSPIFFVPETWRGRSLGDIYTYDAPDNGGGGGGTVTPTNLKHVFSADGKQVTLSWDPIPGATFAVRLNNTANDGTPGATDGWFVNDGTDFAVDTTEPSATFPIVAGHNYQWWLHASGGPQTTGEPFTAPTQGGTMTKPVIVNWVTQDEAVENAAAADHFVVTLDAASANEPLTSKTHTFLNIPSGPHSGTVACADAQGNLLAPAVPYTVTVPADPTAPIPVSVTVNLG